MLEGFRGVLLEGFGGALLEGCSCCLRKRAARVPAVCVVGGKGWPFLNLVVARVLARGYR